MGNRSYLVSGWISQFKMFECCWSVKMALAASPTVSHYKMTVLELAI